VVEQRFCKPLVGSSNLSPGTNKKERIFDSATGAPITLAAHMGFVSQYIAIISGFVGYKELSKVWLRIKIQKPGSYAGSGRNALTVCLTSPRTLCSA
jgi:hypothetical protein